MLRFGRKDNDIKHFSQYLPKDVTNVVEPYGGFFGIIRKEYWDEKYNKFVNDNDDMMCFVYKHPDALFRAAVRINEAIESQQIKTKKDLTAFLTSIRTPKKLIDYFRKAFVWINKVHVPPDLSQFIKMWKTITFVCKDALKVTALFATDPNTFIFVDPPYYDSFNKQYQQTQSSLYSVQDELLILKKIMKARTTKAKMMLVINSAPFVDELFKDMIIDSYEKTYSMTQKKDKLLVITNY